MEIGEENLTTMATFTVDRTDIGFTSIGLGTGKWANWVTLYMLGFENNLITVIRNCSRKWLWKWCINKQNSKYEYNTKWDITQSKIWVNKN